VVGVPAGPPMMSCAVCARVLTTALDPGSTVFRYEHDPLDQVVEDHPPVPVPQDAVQTVRRCDFCTTDDPAWLLPARAFAVGEVLPTYSVEPWLACDACAELLRRNAWTRLRERCVKIRVQADPELGPDQLAYALAKMWRELRRNITGDLVPIPPATGG
jgi:hypothetical protein